MPSLLASLTPKLAYEMWAVPFLAGSKESHRVGHCIYVSPAMWSLLEGADADEVDRLLDAIPVRVWESPTIDLLSGV